MEAFQEDVYRGCLVKADLTGAIRYIGQFPDQKPLLEKYLSLFEKEQYRTYEVEPELNQILLVYQRYYRDVLYLNIAPEHAERAMLERLQGLLQVEDPDISMERLEETNVAQAFTQKGYFFQGGQTGGVYGPYIWKTTERQTFTVELPDGTKEYAVQFMDGFLSRSWMDYISFGKVGTGGWADETGLINCVKSAYDVDSESFRVSLLKHEAQHARDRANYEGMTSQQLEYRAKLVELIYSEERNLLKPFLLEAGTSQETNGHALAAEQLAEGFEREAGCPRNRLEILPIPQIQAIAKTLFVQSGDALQAKRKGAPHAY